jgi:hypothetical protein
VISIVLVKYQFRLSGDTNAQSLRKFYFTVPDTTRPDSSVVNFINEKYGK